MNAETERYAIMHALLVLIWVEVLGLLLVAGLAKWCAPRRLRFVGLLWRQLGIVGRRKKTSVAGVFFLCFATGAGVSFMRPPHPNVHDEFSYLLAADTFANGRVANPQHPMWEHFETMHVLVRPTYASKYPPAQGLVLGLGQRIGHPLIGVWLGSAIAAAAVCWMLQGWVPGRWAILGSVILLMHPFIQLQWGQSYWGGQVFMFSAALVFGAMGRFRRRAGKSSALAMACGVAGILNTRPYEGFWCCVPTAVIMCTWCFRQFIGREGSIGKALAILGSVAMVLVPVFFAMGYYNWRITGNVAVAPYSLHQSQYGATPLFLFQSAHEPPPYHHRVLEEFYVGFSSRDFWGQQTLSDVLRVKQKDLFAFWVLILHALWTVALVAGVFMWRRFSVRYAACTLLGVAGSLAVPWFHFHYAAGFVPILVLFVVEGCRRLNVVGPRKSRFGRRLVIGSMLVWGLLFLQQLFKLPEPKEFGVRRDEIQARLKSMPGRDLVLVRYRLGHDVDHEWVYNSANIDDSDVVWAREMSPERNRRLLAYFGDRRVWLLEADTRPPNLIEHKGSK